MDAAPIGFKGAFDSPRIAVLKMSLMKRAPLWLCFCLASLSLSVLGEDAYGVRTALLEEVFLDGAPGRNGIVWEMRVQGDSEALTRMASPTPSALEALVDSLGENDRKQFLGDFLLRYVSGEYRKFKDSQDREVDKARDVVDAGGRRVPIDVGSLRRVAENPYASLGDLRDAGAVGSG